MIRYIVVQTSAVALYGAFTTVDRASAAIIQAAACASCAEWVNAEDRPDHLNTDTYLYEVRNELCVFEVPADFPAYDKDMIDATSVSHGGIFENFKDFPFVGTLGKRTMIEAKHARRTYCGVSYIDDNDVRFDEAVRDLSTDLPHGEDGDVVTVTDEDGDVVGTLTYEESYGACIFQKGAPVNARDPEDDRASRMTTLKATMLQKLELLSLMGHVVYFDEQMDGFAIDLKDGVSVEFEGFDHAGPTFTVKMSGGTEREVQYDISQMPFADNLEAYEDIAADPLGWCQDAAGVERTATAA